MAARQRDFEIPGVDSKIKQAKITIDPNAPKGRRITVTPKPAATKRARPKGTLHVRRSCIVWVTFSPETGVTVEYIPCADDTVDEAFTAYVNDVCTGATAQRAIQAWQDARRGRTRRPITVAVGRGGRELWHVTYSPSGVSVVQS